MNSRNPNDRLTGGFNRTNGQRNSYTQYNQNKDGNNNQNWRRNYSNTGNGNTQNSNNNQNRNAVRVISRENVEWNEILPIENMSGN